MLDKHPPNFIDITGKVFGEWIVISFDYSKHGSASAYWLCKCKCGKEKSVRGTALLTKKSKSCQSCSKVGDKCWRFVEKIKVNCFQCGKVLERIPSLINRNEKHFCNHKCFSTYKLSIPIESHPRWKGGKSSKTQTDELLNCYVKSLLRQSGYENKNIIPEMIEFKRQQIMLHRELKQLKGDLGNGVAGTGDL